MRAEGEESEEPVDREQAKQVHCSLYHLHVPKLAEAGLVEYDEGERRVALADSTSLDRIGLLEL